MTNLIPEIQEKRPQKGDSFDRALAKRAAIRIYTKCVEDERKKIILAGKAVAKVFMPKTDPQYFAPYKSGNMTIYVIPHPSGINHFWNDPTNVDKASRFLRAIVFDWPMNHPSVGGRRA
jgi:hypothetical protein